MTGYLNNPKLRKANHRIRYTKEQVNEFLKCVDKENGLLYFLTHYYKIVHVDRGLIQFEPFPFQVEMAKAFDANRFVICKLARQMGKTTIVAAYLTWVVLFHAHKAVAIVANKERTAREILSRIKIAYENLPTWLQQGVTRWDQGKIEFENGSSILASATSISAIRGGSFAIVYLDEFAFVETHVADEFYESVYPTISSGSSTKLLITSTPRGYNHFWTIWDGAVTGKNAFVPIGYDWRAHPERDETWAREQLSNMTREQFSQEFEAQFQGSAQTLISPHILSAIQTKDPISEYGDMRIWERPQPGHRYVLVCDPAEGVGQDYSAYIIFDVTNMPYRQVATFQSRTISPMVLPGLIVQSAKSFNDAYVVIESQQVGFQVAYSVWFDHGYQNLFTYFRERNKHKFQIGYRRGYFGVKTNVQIKSTGCANLKVLVESGQLCLYDRKLIMELSNFSFDGTTFRADDGQHDDMVMCCVLFAWMTKQEAVRNITSINPEKVIESLENLPSSTILGQDPLFRDDDDGLVWTNVENTSFANFDFGGNQSNLVEIETGS